MRDSTLLWVVEPHLGLVSGMTVIRHLANYVENIPHSGQRHTFKGTAAKWESLVWNSRSSTIQCQISLNWIILGVELNSKRNSIPAYSLVINLLYCVKCLHCGILNFTFVYSIILLSLLWMNNTKCASTFQQSCLVIWLVVANTRAFVRLCWTKKTKSSNRMSMSECALCVRLLLLLDSWSWHLFDNP